MGSITGASRVCFAGGQTVSPIVCAVLYVQAPWLAVGSMMAVALMVPVVFFLTGQPFFVDPPPPAPGQPGGPPGAHNGAPVGGQVELGVPLEDVAGGTGAAGIRRGYTSPMGKESSVAAEAAEAESAEAPRDLETGRGGSVVENVDVKTRQ